ncbi:heterocyst frequency control protein PatD [Geminocystis herdmanii]|uniref:heterocyst frequency control protein PatD n=1 Tax=Geminocystis herdmanii TaxID=669359 RepID=UPI000345E4E7|nr:heterocyst frequency control protein PatD [Geminocystis herdmanii]
MLSKSHQEELLSWIELLKNFDTLFCDDVNNLALLKDKFRGIQTYLDSQIMSIEPTNLDSNIRALFQSWQTETHRYIRLLQTDFLFYQSAKQSSTKLDRISLIQQRLKDAIKLTENYLMNNE